MGMIPSGDLPILHLGVSSHENREVGVYSPYSLVVGNRAVASNMSPGNRLVRA